MKRSTRPALLVLALVLSGAVFLKSAAPAAQSTDALITVEHAASLTTIHWFGAFAITPHDTVRLNYANLGSDPVRISWALTNAEEDELVCGDLKRQTEVMPGHGLHWDYSQTLETNSDGTVIETRHCGGEAIRSDELYFDLQSRHQLLAWTFVEHLNKRAMKTAVDLSTVELFNSMIMPDGMRTMTFGRTFAFIGANPTAPPDSLLSQFSR